MEGGFLGLGAHSGAGPPPCLLLPAAAILSSPRQLQHHFGYQTRGACPLTAPGRRRGLCPLPPGYPAKLPELPGHFASSSRSQPPSRSSPTRGPPVSAQRFSVQSAAKAGFHPGSSRDPFSPTAADTASATAALPWARTRVRCGDPARGKGPEAFPRWPGDSGAENVPAGSIHGPPAGLGK